MIAVSDAHQNLQVCDEMHLDVLKYSVFVCYQGDR